MMAGAGSGLPHSVLFLCTKNAVRSVIAAYLADRHCRRRVFVASAGIDPADEMDGFVYAVLEEVGIDSAKHRPRGIEEDEAEQFDLIVTLSPEAQHWVSKLHLKSDADFEYWRTMDPTIFSGGTREQALEGYRQLRDGLQTRIEQRFDFTGPGHL